MNDCNEIWKYDSLPSFKEIVCKYNVPDSIDILGKTMDISPEMNVYIHLRKKYYIIAKNCNFIKNQDKTEDLYRQILVECSLPFSKQFLSQLLLDVYDFLVDDAESVGIKLNIPTIISYFENFDLNSLNRKITGNNYANCKYYERY